MLNQNKKIVRKQKGFTRGGLLERSLFFRILEIFKPIRAFILEKLYPLHVKIRSGHDLAYRKSKTYKKYSDVQITHTVHKATLWAVIISFILFNLLQLLLPKVFDVTSPTNVYAADSTGSNTPTAGNITNSLNINSSSSPMKLALQPGGVSYPAMSSGGYSYLKQITVTNNSGAQVTTSMQVAVPLDHKALVASGKSLANGDDLRVFYWTGSAYVELNRFGDNWNSADVPTTTSTIWFKPYSAINNGQFDSNYYFAYGKPSATNPPTANVFTFFDDFSGAALDTTTNWANTSTTTVSGSVATVTAGGFKSKNALGYNLNGGYSVQTKMRFNADASLACNQAMFSGAMPEVSSSPGSITAGNTGSSSFILMMRNSGLTCDGYGATTGTYDYVSSFSANGAAVGYNVDPSSIRIQPPFANGGWHYMSTDVFSSGYKLNKDGTNLVTQTGVTWSKNLNYISLGEYTGTAAMAISSTSYDFVRVSNYYATPPTYALNLEAHASTGASDPNYQPTGSFESAVIDSAYTEAKVSRMFWSTLSNGVTTQPTNAVLQLQVATSPNNSAWSSYVGPDGTTGTYFTSATGLDTISALIKGRYFKYKAFLSNGSDQTVTPSLYSVSMDFVITLNGDVNGGDLIVGDSQNYTMTGGGGARNFNSITVRAGGILNIPGATTVTVANAINLTGNSQIVAQATNRTYAGAVAGVGVTINAGSVSIEAGSSINSNGQGYLGGDNVLSPRGGYGPGGGNSVSTSGYGGGGGAYGGFGGPGALAGIVSANNPQMTTYGSVTNPVDLGSGGSNLTNISSSAAGASGGGAIKLTVTGNLIVNGSISSDGQASSGIVGYTCSRAGSGSGGSVYVSANNISGSGSVTATGGTQNPAGYGCAINGTGGGGRVAIYYGVSTLAASNVSANTGAATYTALGTGGNGTVVYQSTALDIYAFSGQKAGSSYIRTGDFTGTTSGNIDLSFWVKAPTTANGVYFQPQVEIKPYNGTFDANPADFYTGSVVGGALGNLQLGKVSVPLSGLVNGQKYKWRARALYPDDVTKFGNWFYYGANYGVTDPGVATSVQASDNTTSGDFDFGVGSGSAVLSPAFPAFKLPMDGNYNIASSTNFRQGVFELTNAAGTGPYSLNIGNSSTLSVDTLKYTDTNINITTGTSENISVGTWDWGTSNPTATNSFTLGSGQVSVTANLTIGQNKSLYIPAGSTLSATEIVSGGLLSFGDNSNGASVTININSITLNSGSLILPSNSTINRSTDFTVGVSGTATLTIGGNSTFNIASNKLQISNSSSIVPQGYWFGNSGANLSIGTNYLDDKTRSFPSVVVGMTLYDGIGTPMTITGLTNGTLTNSKLLLSGTPVGSNGKYYSFGGGLTINASNLQVDSSSKIDANGQGYSGASYTPVANGSFSVSGFGPGGGGSFSGGSFGGTGGYNYPGPKYGDALKGAPIDLGSGGGVYCSGIGTNCLGGNGGGAIKLSVTNTLENNGSILANGGAPNFAGMGAAGSGGSVYISTNVLKSSNTGVITASGGTFGVYNSSIGAGGGRIAVYFVTNSWLGTPLTTVSMAPAGYTGPGYAQAQNGTLVIGGSVLNLSGMTNLAGTSGIKTGGYTNETGINLNFWVSTSGSDQVFTPQIELKEQSIPFDGSAGSLYTGTQVVTGSNMQLANVNLPLTTLINGKTYHWRARVQNGAGNWENWVNYGGSPFDFGVNTSSSGGGSSYPDLTISMTQNILNTQSSLSFYQGNISFSGAYSLTFTGSLTVNTTGDLNLPSVTNFPAPTSTNMNIGGNLNIGASAAANFAVGASSTITTVNLTIGNGTAATNFTIGGNSTINTTGTLTVKTNSTLVPQSTNTTSNTAYSGKGLTINTANLTVESGATINADSQGYQGSPNTNANGSHGYGPGGGASSWWGSGGGSHGGFGGEGSKSVGICNGNAQQNTYDLSQSPTDLGSGGAGGGGGTPDYAGAAGGGAIKIVASGTTTVNGTISANGGNGQSGFQTGSGAGGSVWINTNAMNGSGFVKANGGTSADIGGGQQGGPGGGGRIAIYYASKTLPVGNVTANAGAHTQLCTYPASAGSVIFLGKPGNFSFTNNGTAGTSVNLSWDSPDATTGTYGFKIYRAGHNGAETTDTSDCGTLPSSTIICKVGGAAGRYTQQIDGLSANSSTTFHVHELTTGSPQSTGPESSDYVVSTLIESAGTALIDTAQTTKNQIVTYPSNASYSNFNLGSSHICYYVYDSGNTLVNTFCAANNVIPNDGGASWKHAFTGLNPNKTYYTKIETFNQASSSSGVTAASANEVTKPESINPGGVVVTTDSLGLIPWDPAIFTSYRATHQVYMVNNLNHFGVGYAEYFKYNLDTNSADTLPATFTNTWVSASGLILTPSAVSSDGQYYLHIAGYNSANAVGDVLKLGPFKMDINGPSIANSSVGDANWHNQNVNYNVTLSDPDSGVKELYLGSSAASGSNPSSWTKVNGADINLASYNANTNLPTAFWNGLPQGTDYIFVKSVDVVGNFVISPSILTVKKDTVAPTITTFTSSSNSTKTSTVTLSINANDPNGTNGTAPANSGLFQMRFSNDNVNWCAWENFNNSKSWDLNNTGCGGNTQDGLKIVYAQVSDHISSDNTLNNIGTAQTSQVVYDITSPNVTSVSAKTSSGGSSISTQNWVNTNSPYFTWTATDPTVNSASSGIDKYYISIDSPTTPISANPQNWTKNASIQLPAVVTDANNHLNISALSEGKHKVYVQAIDNVGNSAGTVSYFEIWVDTTAPVIDNQQSGDNTWRNDNSALYKVNFSETNADLSKFEVATSKNSTYPSGGLTFIKVTDLSGTSYAPVNGWGLPKAVWDAMPEGTNYVYVKVYDASTSSNSTNISTGSLPLFYIKKDTTSPASTGPATANISTTNNSYYTTNPVITLPAATDPNSGDSSHVDHVYYIWDLDKTKPNPTVNDFNTSSPTTFGANIDMNATVGQGIHKLFWLAKDVAGNYETAVNSQTFRLDSTAPSVTTVSVADPNGAHNYYTSSPLITLNYSDPNTAPDVSSGYGNIYYKWDLNNNSSSTPSVSQFNGGAPATYNQSSKLDMASTIGEGTHTLYWISQDFAGNYEQVVNTKVFNYDASAPSGLSINFNINADTNGNGYSKNANGDVVLTIGANDTGTSHLDTYELSDSGSAGQWFSQTIAGGLDNYTNASVNWNLNDATYGGTNNEETKTVYVRFTDIAGLQTVISKTIIWHVTPPAIFDVISPANNLWQNSLKPSFVWNPSDSAIGLDKYQIYVDNKLVKDSVAPVTPFVFSTPSADIDQGNWSWYILAYDKAGNTTKSTSTRSIGIDSLAPSMLLDSGFTFSASTNVDKLVNVDWIDYSDDFGITSPLATYTVERTKLSSIDATHTLDTNNWGSLPGYSTTTLGAFDNVVTVKGKTIHRFTEYSASDPDPTHTPKVLDDGVKYVYRIKAADTAGNSGNWLANSIGLTDDTNPPTDPSSVSAVTCDGSSTYDPINNANGTCLDPARKGFENKLSWTGSTDGGGVGVVGYKIYRKAEDYSPKPGDYTLIGYLTTTIPQPLVFFDNDVSSSLSYSETIRGTSKLIKPASNVAEVKGDGTQTTGNFDLRLNDNTGYYYRITSIDANGNESNVITLTTDVPPAPSTLNEASTTTPDVTAPKFPTGDASFRNIRAVASGIDGIADDGKQKVDLNWTPSSDERAAGRIPTGLGTGIAKYSLYMAKGDSNGTDSGPIEAYQKLTDISTIDQATGGITASYNANRLDEATYYYFYLTSTDNVGITSLASTITGIRTATASAPNAPSNVHVFANKGNQLTDASVGKTVKVNFTGSKIRYAENMVTGYEIYRSTTLLSGNAWLNATKVKTYDGLTISGSTYDAGENGCPTDQINFNNQSVTVHQRCFDDTIPDNGDGLTYYYAIRAMGYNATADPHEVSSQFSSINKDYLNAGWDIVPFVTRPKVTADQLLIKVKDAYPNPNNGKIRNILTWQVPDPPVRPRLANETSFNPDTNPNGCDLVRKDVNGHIVDNSSPNAVSDWCNIFGKYEVHRVLTLDSNVLDQVATEITDRKTNLYMDEVDQFFSLYKFSYYFVIYDNVGTSFHYLAPNNSTIVNSTSNFTGGHLNALYSLTPGKAFPVISNVRIEKLNVATATIAWDTDQDTDAIVEFKEKWIYNPATGKYDLLNTGPYSMAIGNRSVTPDHHINIFGLKPNTEYLYQVVSTNYPLINTTTKSDPDVPALKTENFFVTYKSAAPTTTSVTITWESNMDANSNLVEYQKDAGQGGDPQSSTAGPDTVDMTTRTVDQLTSAEREKLRIHTTVINGLRPDTAYTYNIKSISLDGFVASKNLLHFRSKPFDTEQFVVAPSSSNVAERNINATTARIAWQTNIASTSWVDYGITKGKYDYSAGNDQLTNQHVVVVEGLVPGTTYYYQCRSKDANGQIYTSKEDSFKAVLKPKISNFKIVKVSSYEATVSWETNVDTETTINWGKTAAYGEKKGNAGTAKAHIVTVSNLDDNTEYHMQITAHDEAGNEVADEDRIIRTPLDTAGPQIIGVKTDILPIGADEASASVIVSWQTDKPGSTLVEYDEGIIGGKYGQQSIEDKSLNTSHTVILKDLKPASSYHFKIVSKDKRGNVGQSPDHTFVTPSKEKSILQLILKALEDTFSWTQNVGKFFTNVGKRVSGK